MNNDQLKNKIMGIISTVLLSKVMKEKYILKCGDIERIADALIAAGIGDVKEAERKSFVFKNELAFTIHRARAAELVAEAAAETGIENGRNETSRGSGGEGVGFMRNSVHISVEQQRA